MRFHYVPGRLRLCANRLRRLPCHLYAPGAAATKFLPQGRAFQCMPKRLCVPMLREPLHDREVHSRDNMRCELLRRVLWQVRPQKPGWSVSMKGWQYLGPVYD